MLPLPPGIATVIDPSDTLDRMHDRYFYAYIVASRTHVLYVGVTGAIERRVQEHKTSTYAGFTTTYRCNRLVWFEQYTSAAAAIAREKQQKGWRREKKIALIERDNPAWIDLSENWGNPFPLHSANSPK